MLLGAGATYLLLALCWAAPASLSPADTAPDWGDPLHLGWVMAWDAHQILHRPWALFDANTFYPYPHSLAFGDHLLPEALLVAPVQWLTGNPVLAANLELLLALTMAGLAMLCLVRALTGSALAGLLAGLAYAFNSFTLHEVLRVHVLNVQWWPLAMLFLCRFVESGRGRDAALLAASCVLQGLSGGYYLVYTAMLLPVWLLAAYAAAGRRPGWPELRRLGLPLGAGGLVAAPLLWPYVVQLRSMGFEKELREGLDLVAYLSPPPAHTLLGRFAFLPGEVAASAYFVGFVGAALMLVGCVSVIARRAAGAARLGGAVALATAAGGVLLSLGPSVAVFGTRWVAGPYALLYEYVPLSRGMASPKRAVVLTMLGGAVLLGLAAARILARAGAAWRPMVGAALAALLVFEQWSPTRTGAPVPTGRDVPAAYRWLAAQPSEPTIDLPLYPDVAKRLWATYLYFSTYHWRPIPIGRTSFYPPAHDYLAWSLRDFPDELSLGVLQRLGIATLVVHPLVWEAEPDRVRRLAALEADPRVHLLRRFEDRPPGRYETLQLGEERVYRLDPAPTAGPSPCQPAREVARRGWSFRSTGIARPELAIDGDPRTGWYTRAPQQPGDRLEVTLPQQETLAAITIRMWYPHTEFARNLILVTRPDAGEWRRAAYADGPQERGEVIQELVTRPREARLVLRFAPQPVRSFRLAVGWREQDASWPAWTVAELQAYRECR